MSDLPTIDDATDEVKKRGASLIPWLDDPHECECGALCEATTEYVGQMASYEDVWVCPECSNRYYRERE
jgi:hypothetical protein